MANLIERTNLGNYEYQVYDNRPDFKLIEVNQVHGNNVVTKANIDADGIVSDLNLETPAAIKTADCLPIAVIGNKGVANIHAGWRGIHKKILLAQVIKDIQPELFYIGPHISVRNYEVSKDFTKNFQNEESFLTTNDSLYFNMLNEVTKQIQANYPKAKILHSKLCTFEDARLNSYRENKTDKRNWNILINKSAEKK